MIQLKFKSIKNKRTGKTVRGSLLDIVRFTDENKGYAPTSKKVHHRSVKHLRKVEQRMFCKICTVHSSLCRCAKPVLEYVPNTNDIAPNGKQQFRKSKLNKDA